MGSFAVSVALLVPILGCCLIPFLSKYMPFIPLKCFEMASKFHKYPDLVMDTLF